MEDNVKKRAQCRKSLLEVNAMALDTETYFISEIAASLDRKTKEKERKGE